MNKSTFSTRYGLSAIAGIFNLAIPIAIQTAVFSSKSTVDTLMLSSLSGYDVAAIGLASKAQLIITFFVIGICIGGGQIAAQCWGAAKYEGKGKFSNSVLITLLLSFWVSLFFFIILFFYPSSLMALGTDSEAIISRGSDYLKIIAPSLFCFAFTSSLAAGLRAMHQPALVTKISAVGVVLNVVLNWVFIFGHFGAPELGIKGAALGTLISAVFESALLYFYLKRSNHLLGSWTFSQVRNVKKQDIKIVAGLSMTAAFNSVIWAGGLFAFHAILGRSDENLLISLSVLAPVEALAMSLLIGLSTAGSVLIGNLVGGNQYDKLKLEIQRLVLVSLITGVATTLLLWFIKSPVIDLFFPSPSIAKTMTVEIYDIMAISIIIKSLSMMLIVGILRAGGDAKFCLFTDVFAQWVFLLPCAAVMAHVLNMPAQYLYGLVLAEEGVKTVICYYRMRTPKWLKDYSQAMT